MGESRVTIDIGILTNAKKSIDQARTRLRTALTARANQGVLLDGLETDLELVDVQIRLGLEALSPAGCDPEPGSWQESWQELYGWAEAQIKQAPAFGADPEAFRRILWKMNQMEMSRA